MKKQWALAGLIWAVACGAALAGTAENLTQRAPVARSRKRVSSEQLPPAVQNTLKRQPKGTEIRDITETRVRGRTFYEVTTLRRGQRRTLVIDAAGKIVRVARHKQRFTRPK